MAEFKVGDLVRCIRANHYGIDVGTVLVVRKVEPSFNCLEPGELHGDIVYAPDPDVQNDPHEWWVHDTDVEEVALG